MASARQVTPKEREAIEARIAELGPWFHNFELASGLWTNPSGNGPGIDYPLTRWKLVETLLPDVRGKACLDVGCSSGFFSLKLKELGAAYVLGIDDGEQTRAIDQARFAAKSLGLDAEFRVLPAYDIARLEQRFELVLFLGVFYHLRHPLVALEAIRSVCTESMIFQTVTTKHDKSLSELDAAVTGNVAFRSSTMEEPRFPSLRFIEGALEGDVTCWFVPNLQAVMAILRSCGFQPGEMRFMNDQDVIVSCKV